MYVVELVAEVIRNFIYSWSKNLVIVASSCIVSR